MTRLSEHHAVDPRASADSVHFGLDEPSVLRQRRMVRLRWFVSQVPAFTIGWSLAQTLGEVVGEAWGGARIHLLGHTTGTVLTIALCSAAGWLTLRRDVTWIRTWALASTVGAAIGGALLATIVALGADVRSETTIALTLYLPLTTAAISQAVVLRRRIGRPVVWALSWALAVFLGVAVQWFGSGGVGGVSVTTVHPVLDVAAAYLLDAIPMSALGAIAYAATTTIALPLAQLLSDSTSE